MGFLLEQLRQLGMAAVIMACAVGGTVALLKLIRRFAPGVIFSKDAAANPFEDAEHPDQEGLS